VDTDGGEIYRHSAMIELAEDNARPLGHGLANPMLNDIDYI
jgi:hypothetical protein